jgi:hypothetical protein
LTYDFVRGNTHGLWEFSVKHYSILAGRYRSFQGGDFRFGNLLD